MAEKHHVETWPPNANVAPEIYPDAVRHEPGAEAQSDDINISIVVFSVIFCVLALVALIAGIEAYYNNENYAEAEAKFEPSVQLQELHQTWDQQLHGEPSWVDKNNGIARIPIDQAIELVIPQLQKPAVNVPEIKPGKPDKGG